MITADRIATAGKTYLRLVPFLGACVLGWCLLDLILRPASLAWLALAALTVLTGSFTVKIPGLVARLSVSEPFVFAATLWFGPSVGAVTASLDGLIMSLWLLPNLKTAHRVAFNVSVLVISIWVASQGFFFLSGIDARAPEYRSLAEFVVPLYVFTGACFLLNSGMVALALAFERGQSAFRIWREQFLWLSLNYFGGASVAAVLVVYAKGIDWALVGVIVPLLAISYLTFRTTMGRLDDAGLHLHELNKLYLSTIETLAMAVDAKDQVTSGHIRRVQRYALGLANALGTNDEKQIKAVEAAALLHDMGKLAIPEYILNKPGRLTPQEFGKMKLHAAIGADILSSIEFPYPVVPIVRHHHENWDGTGYPDGLRGTEIPLGARILSVVDCFDALTSDRPYRPKLTVEDALRVIVERRGSMYDPLVVDTFAEHLDRLEASVLDLGPESETLKQIAELNNPAAIAALQASARLASSGPAEHRLDAHWLRRLSGPTQTEDLAAVMLGRVAGRLPATGCAVSVLARDGATLFTASTAGLVPPRYAGVRTDLGRRIGGWVASTRAVALNSPAVLDLDEEYGTGGLISSLVCPLVDGEELYGVLAFYADKAEAFNGQHQTDVERLSRILVQFIKSISTDALPPSAGVLDTPLEALLSQANGIQGWLPVGIVVTRFRSAPDSWMGQQMIPRMLRGAVRAEDFLLQIERNSFLLLLLRSNDDVTAGVASRLRDQFTAANIQIEIDWASVTNSGSAESTSMSAVADAIRQKAREASQRAFGVTH
jgi:putative nucleotidyltransferase with HDIG domain